MYRFILCFLAIALIVTACTPSHPTDPGTNPASMDALQIPQETIINNAEAAQDEVKPAQDAPDSAEVKPEQAAPAMPEAKPEEPKFQTSPVVREKDVLLPGFAIQVNLDDAAKAKLIEMHETIIVAAYYGLYPREDAPAAYEKYVSEDGEFSLVNKNIEITHDKPIAVFNEVTCPRELYDVLTEPDKNKIKVLINIFSGRKASPNNILDCNILEEKLSDVTGKAHVLSCKLLNI